MKMRDLADTQAASKNEVAATRKDVERIVDGAKWQMLMICISATIALMGMLGAYVTFVVDRVGKS